MKVFRCISLLLIFVSVASIGAQTSQSGNLTVEQSYLQQSVEIMIIREQSRADSREMKFVALEYIGDAISRGNTSDEIRASLEYLGIEGTINQTRENGRLMNNFPDVRVRAATHLGSLGTREAQQSLIKMCLADNEPMVLAEVIKSLARIGIDDNDQTVNAISWVVNHFNATNPDNLLALSALEAFEILAQTNGGIRSNAIETIMRIAEGPYIRPVQDRAKQLLDALRRTNAR
jgi:plasmid stability protein